MTLNRFFITVLVILAMIGGVLVFGNPQWRWCYVVQARINAWQKGSNLAVIHPPAGYKGIWYFWDKTGVLKFIRNYDGDGLYAIVYSRSSSVDRRAEFGIAVD